MLGNLNEASEKPWFQDQIQPAASVEYRPLRFPVLPILSQLRRGRPVAPVLKILNGGVTAVVRGLRRLASLHKKKLSATQRRTLNTICNFFMNNRHRMQYDRYLSRGYPIASGAIEGACRHLVKDRMERSGMNWSIPGAQAILSLRAIHIGDHWDDFIQYRIQRETARLYPYRDDLNSLEWAIAI